MLADEPLNHLDKQVGIHLHSRAGSSDNPGLLKNGHDAENTCSEMASTRLDRHSPVHNFLDNELVPVRTSHALGLFPYVVRVLSYC